MGRRMSDSDPSGKKPCAFCRTMRVVVIFAVIIVMLLNFSDRLYWLEGIDFTTLFSYLVLAFFFSVLGYRVWDEYGRPKKTNSDRAEKRARQEQKFDELDALEAQRTALKELELEAIKLDDSASKTVNMELTQQDLPDSLIDGPLESLELKENPQLEPNAAPEQLDLLGFATHTKTDK